MPKYVDGFVLVVPKKNIETYKKMSRKAGKIWREFGALEYRECVGDDMKVKFGLPFPKLTKTKPSETVVFSWIIYKSRKDRDRINAKIMADKRMHEGMEQFGMPFDMKKMAYGGFEILVDV